MRERRARDARGTRAGDRVGNAARSWSTRQTAMRAVDDVERPGRSPCRARATARPGRTADERRGPPGRARTRGDGGASVSVTRAPPATRAEQPRRGIRAGRLDGDRRAARRRPAPAAAAAAAAASRPSRSSAHRRRRSRARRAAMARRSRRRVRDGGRETPSSARDLPAGVVERARRSARAARCRRRATTGAVRRRRTAASGSSGTRRAERSPQAERRGLAQRRARASRRRRSAVDDARRRRARARDGDSRSRPNGSAPAAQIVRRDDDDVDVARQRAMLKPVVEDVHGGAERALGQRARRRRARRRRARPRRAPRAPASAARRRCDRDRRARCVPSLTTTTPSSASAPSVAAAQNGRPLAGVDEQPRDERDDRRLAAPAHREVADADDGDGRVPQSACRGRSRPDAMHCGKQPVPLDTPERPDDAAAAGRRQQVGDGVRACAAWRRGWPRRARAPRRRAARARPDRRSAARSSPAAPPASAHLHGRLVAAGTSSAISAKFSMCGPNTIGLPCTAGSRMLCPP